MEEEEKGILETLIKLHDEETAILKNIRTAVNVLALLAILGVVVAACNGVFSIG